MSSRVFSKSASSYTYAFGEVNGQGDYKREKKTGFDYSDDWTEDLLLHGDRLRILGEDDSGLDEVPLRVIGCENSGLSTI